MAKLEFKSRSIDFQSNAHPRLPPPLLSFFPRWDREDHRKSKTEVVVTFGCLSETLGELLQNTTLGPTLDNWIRLFGGGAQVKVFLKALHVMLGAAKFENQRCSDSKFIPYIHVYENICIFFYIWIWILLLTVIASSARNLPFVKLGSLSLPPLQIQEIHAGQISREHLVLGMYLTKLAYTDTPSSCMLWVISPYRSILSCSGLLALHACRHNSQEFRKPL